MNIKELITEAKTVFASKWETRVGRKVPDPDDLKLGNDAITLEGTVLYADMADSTGLVKGFRPEFAAEIYKTYLMGACRIIRENSGEITSFDGDRVMAVFIGGSKNSSAAKAALQINAYVIALNSAIKESYPTTSYVLRQTVGIDASDLFVARTGIRNANDLVWVGKAANYAAKLCSLGESGFSTYITEAVYRQLNDTSKYGGQPRKDMWEKRTWTEQGQVIYRSNWRWDF